MKIQFYDTRQRGVVEFTPLVTGKVTMYTCGPTVYADAHIGNFRTYMFEDLLRRMFEHFGYKVTQVMNLTDVEDKTIRESVAKGISLKEHTSPFVKSFFEDLDTLGIERAEHYPAATDHIPEMIALIESLIERGYAYTADNNVYFSIEKFKEYGKLSGKDLSQLLRGVRIDADEYEEKENFRDFALWKGWSEADGEVWWDSPWGKGRPGWHIECSAMSMKYLGGDFDIHTGGVDNIFPHHENEIAQSVAGTGCGFARYWLHSAHLIVNGEKMSKSQGNFFTVKQLLAKGLSSRVIRFILITAHYRSKLNITDETVASAKASLDRLDTLYQVISSTESDGEVRPELLEQIKNADERHDLALADDLNVSGALAAVFDLVSAVHRLRTVSDLTGAESRLLLEFWKRLDLVWGVLIPATNDLDSAIEILVEERKIARKERNFARADELRKQLFLAGYTIEDSPEGTLVIWGSGRVMLRNN